MPGENLGCSDVCLGMGRDLGAFPCGGRISEQLWSSPAPGKAFPASSVPQGFMKSVVRVNPVGLCWKFHCGDWGDLWDVSEGVFTCRVTNQRLSLNLQLGILSQLGLCSCNSQLESQGPLGSLKWGVSADTREWCCGSEATGVEHSAPCAPQPQGGAAAPAWAQPLHRVCIARQDCTQSWE